MDARDLAISDRMVPVEKDRGDARGFRKGSTIWNDLYLVKDSGGFRSCDKLLTMFPQIFTKRLSIRIRYPL